ncbi:MAG: molybdopterin-dependent oxidoreductase [Proteobacteria bacterium]|nr:molybdopterin-dependent oxidoreductase [Pseudomonadota bacterium]
MEWKKTSCPLCFHNCGLELQVDKSTITKVKADKNHPRTKGYICRKGAKVAHYQNHKERLTHPLKKDGSRFIKVSWEQAVSEIGEKLKGIVNTCGPRSYAYMGGGTVGTQTEMAIGQTFLYALGSRYHYSPAAQEFSGMFWTCGRAYGRQGHEPKPDLGRAKNLLVIGWNGYVSTGVNRAKYYIDEFAKDQDKQLIVVDPFFSETAQRANRHLRLRIGTLALFLKSMIAIILSEGWENKTYIDNHCTDYELILPKFKDFDIRSALDVCALDYDTVKDVAKLYATETTALKTDLGLLMDRQSTMNSYLEMILMAICGRIGMPGGNVWKGNIFQFPHSDERDDSSWRTVETDFPEICGFFPPNVAPEEILSNKDDRIRAMLVSGSNPLRSYADTHAYERAFKKLDLLVTIEIAMSETAQMSDYVLPAKSSFEKWDFASLINSFPEVHFQLRHPCCEWVGEPLEEVEIFNRLAEEMGILPEIPDTLFQYAQGEKSDYLAELMRFAGTNKDVEPLIPLIVSKTLGQSMNSANLSVVWLMLNIYAQSFPGDVARAGYTMSPKIGDTLFQKLMNHPEGIVIGKLDPENNLALIETPDKKIHLYIEEMDNWLQEIEPEAEQKMLNNEEFPMVLMAGRHFQYTANTIMRNPAWNNHKPVCNLLISKDDAKVLGIVNGDLVSIATEASMLTVPAEISDIASPGAVILPHGFGLVFEGRTYGVNVNQLTSSKHRDRLAGTPLHRYVPCRVSKA